MIAGTVYSVTEVTQIIKQHIEGLPVLNNVQIEGEISNFKKYPSGHCYFSLKDGKSILKAVMFAGYARGLQFVPRDGDKVCAVGRIGVYERDGVYQLYTELLVAAGAGKLMLAYEQLKKKLLAEGLFEASRKRALPLHPQRVGIITSSAGAAVRDVIKVARRRNPGIQLLLYPVRVQGAEAAQEIVHAINYMNDLKLADILIVGRGGGSLEDLWSFNEEAVVRAIAASKLPVISAVGHETDFTLSDFVADVRAATPSQAAELAVPDTLGLYQQVGKNKQRLLRQMQNLLELQRTRLQLLTQSESLAQPLRKLEELQQRVDQAFLKLGQSLQQSLQQQTQKWQVAQAKLQAMDPLAVLARGYSVAYDAKGKVVSSIDQVQWGSELQIALRDGSVHTVVQEIRKAEKH